MANYTITKENKVTAITNSVKARLQEIVMQAIQQAVDSGEFDGIAMARTEGSSPKDIMAVKAGTITEEGFDYDFCFGIDITAKSYKEKVTKRYTTPAFDYDEAVERYNANKEAKEAEAREKAEKKAKKIEADKRARELKAKANAEVKAELEKIGE